MRLRAARSWCAISACPPSGDVLFWTDTFVYARLRLVPLPCLSSADTGREALHHSLCVRQRREGTVHGHQDECTLAPSICATHHVSQIKVLPFIAIFNESAVIDHMVGFEDLGNNVRRSAP